MAITFVGAGAFAGNATVNSQAIATSAYNAGDILICALINKSATGNAFSPPAGGWAQVIATEVNDCTTAADDHQYGLYWLRASAPNGGSSFTFTKATDDNVLFGGVIGAYRGVSATNSLDATAAARTETAGASANVSFPAYDPTSTSVRVIYVAYYGQDATTFNAAMSADINPDCTIDLDAESGTGSDCSIAFTSGNNDGSAIAARTWACSPTNGSGSTGVVFALVAGAQQFSQSINGSMSMSGVLTKQVQPGAFTGAMAIGGTLSVARLYYLAIEGAMAITGALTKQARKAVAGTMTSAGTLTKRVRTTVSGTVAMAGVLSKRIQTSVAGSLSIVGVLTKRVQKIVTAAMDITGDATGEYQAGEGGGEPSNRRKIKRWRRRGRF